MMLHAVHDAHAGHSKITIRTVDTDVVVLAVALACTLDEEDEVWVSFDMGKAFRFLAVHEMIRTLGPEKAQALPMFHALTGCDTVSFFAGRGKRTAWEVWTAVPELTQVFIGLTTAPDQVYEDATHTIQTSDQTYEPLWTTLREASEVCRELVSCKCQKVCTKKCNCKKENLECACDGKCSHN